jgi:hypothetical protein
MDLIAGRSTENANSIITEKACGTVPGERDHKAGLLGG